MTIEYKVEALIFYSYCHHLGLFNVYFFTTDVRTTGVSTSEVIISLGIFVWLEGGQEMFKVIWVLHYWYTLLNPSWETNRLNLASLIL